MAKLVKCSPHKPEIVYPGLILKNWVQSGIPAKPVLGGRERRIYGLPVTLCRGISRLKIE